MDLTQRLARFAPVSLTADGSHLTARDLAVIKQLVAAARQVGAAYLRQIWPGNLALRARLASSAEPDDALRLRLFDLHGGPWDEMDRGYAFATEHRRLPGAGFYPEDLSKEEFNAWIEDHPSDRPAFTHYFTTIRRRDGELVAVPYHEEYREQMEPAAAALQEAACLADHPPLAEYLRLRAKALLDDSFFESDCAWVALQDGPIEVLIGPYEVYEDALFGYKAAYECMVSVRDVDESNRFRTLVDLLPALAERLPVPPAYRGQVTGLASPIVVADTVYNSGGLAVVAVPIAFVLPNDPRVRTTVGSKKVMIKNVARAKFANITNRIAEDVLVPEQAAMVTFEDYFGHVLLHEISHAMGLRNIPQPDGTTMPLHQTLRDLYSPIEECKADIVGLHSLLFLAQEGFFPREWQEAAAATFLASQFRMVRTGGGAHAAGNIVAHNFLRERGALGCDQGTGRFWTDRGRTTQAVAELARILLTIEGQGDYAGAAALMERYGTMSAEMAAGVERIRPELPLDLAPTYPWAQE